MGWGWQWLGASVRVCPAASADILSLELRLCGYAHASDADASYIGGSYAGFWPPFGKSDRASFLRCLGSGYVPLAPICPAPSRQPVRLRLRLHRSQLFLRAFGIRTCLVSTATRLSTQFLLAPDSANMATSPAYYRARGLYSTPASISGVHMVGCPVCCLPNPIMDSR